MGRYPLHNHDVALVLNCNICLVSPKLYALYDPLFTTTKDFDLSSLWQARPVFVHQEVHTLSRTDRAAKRASLSTNTSQKEGCKHSCLALSAPGCHSQPEGDPGIHSQQEGNLDAHLYPQEGSSSDDIPSQLGGASQLDAHFSQ